MTRRPFIAGNWKMNLGPQAADRLAMGLKATLTQQAAADVLVFPPALSIPAVVARLKHSGIDVGGQDLHTEESGAYTGCVSGEMLRETGCTYALVGHSERRQYFGESGDLLHQKLRAAFRAGLIPMFCVGETLAQREAGQVEAVLDQQLREGLGELAPDQVVTLSLAYEPVWAIGTGVTASPEQAQEVHAFVRQWLRSRYPSYVADQLRILYGGSVKAHNAESLLLKEDIDGCLVGGASLKAGDFSAIVEAASRV